MTATKKSASKKEATQDKILAGQSITMPDGTVFVPGEEEMAAEVLTAEDVEHLKKHKVIQGFNNQPKREKAKEGSRSPADVRAGGPKAQPTASGHFGRGNAAEPLSATLGADANERSSDEVAEALGGAPLGSDPVTAPGRAGGDVPRGTSSSADGDFNPNKATMAELSERLGASAADVKGTGSNGQVTKKDLVKAYNKANK